MSQPAPHEFAPGDKVLVYQSPVKCEIIRKLSEHWIEVISENGKDAYRVPVQFVAPEKSIALILTREQAAALHLILTKQDGIDHGYPEDERYYREIENQLLDKLR